MNVRSLILATMALTASAFTEAADSPTKPTVVLSGSNSAVKKGDCIRVNSESEWAALWERHAVKYPKSASGLAVQQMPAVDFTRCMLIAVFAGDTVNTLGIEVVQVVENDAEIVLGLDWLAFQAMDTTDKFTPYAFVVLPRSTKPIQLQVDGRGLRERAEDRPPQWKHLHRFTELKK